MRSSTRKTLGAWRTRRGVTIAPTKSGIGAITVRGWSSSAATEARQCRLMVDGTNTRLPSIPTRRIGGKAKRGTMVILPRNIVGLVIGKGSKSVVSDGNCAQLVG